ncbi:MAG: hypothetical protein ACOY31_03820 [Bacillota bacterium]
MMPDGEDLLALPLAEALEILEKSGVRVEIQYTGPAPHTGPADGGERVVRLCLGHGAGKIIAARESDLVYRGASGPGSGN